MHLKQLIPMLNVADIHVSLDFYRRALGFEVVSDPQMLTEFHWATIRSGDTELMVSETDAPPPLALGINPQKSSSWPTIFYFYPDDVRALHARVVAENFSPTEVEERVYGMLEFSLQDPDGHLLSFGEPVA
ncbi:MAG: VOC family protein [Pseudomonadota bacterium]